ncbi:hypothetical protein PVK06_021553 [Gossypium arboreum]|uniref:Reverse transcriptase zinc-binding domain-containing protein n=1 Tax=Gossypium arboreum TaxID=29729 RepID=A0ABR0PQA9_GOSAR|nr:hypothetical protein PVK06_021553 [Gossypium arboreum]
MSKVWKGVAEVRRHEGMDKMLGEGSFIWCVGSGRSISFWMDQWIGLCALKDRFPRLFFLALKKNIMVAEAWDGLQKGERFFKRDLFERERVSAMELWQTFKGVSLNENKADQLMWEVDSKVDVGGGQQREISNVKRKWLVACGAMLWSFWLARNELVLNRKEWIAEDIIFLRKMRSVCWIRAIIGGKVKKGLGDGVGRLLGLIYGPLERMGLFAAECKAVRRQKLVIGLPTDDTV